MKFFPKSADGFLSAMMRRKRASALIFTELPCFAFWCRAHGKRQKSCEKLHDAFIVSVCANAENKHALRARLCKANADRDGQRAVHEHRQRGERPAVRCGGYCGEHKARSAGNTDFFR